MLTSSNSWLLSASQLPTLDQFASDNGLVDGSEVKVPDRTERFSMIRAPRPAPSTDLRARGETPPQSQAKSTGLQARADLRTPRKETPELRAPSSEHRSAGPAGSLDCWRRRSDLRFSQRSPDAGRRHRTRARHRNRLETEVRRRKKPGRTHEFDPHSGPPRVPAGAAQSGRVEPSAW